MIDNFSTVKKVKWLVSVVLFLMTITCAQASHLRAGQITIVRSSCTSQEVFITVTVYTNTASEVKFGEDGTLYFGDGNSIVIPRVENIPQPQLGPNIGIASYTIRHIYASVGSYLVSYVEPNRNGGVLNMNDSFFTTFYLETLFDLAALGCNNSPQLRIPPIDQACGGVAFYHNPGAFDVNPVGPADSLSYELVVPYRDRGMPVNGYLWPDNRKFSEKSEDEGPPTFTIDPVDGTMIWDAPKVPGEYNVAFNVVEWRKTNGQWRRIGYVRRDMQIIVNDDCENERPILVMPNDTCVVAGAHINKDIIGKDLNSPVNPIRLQAFSEVFEFPVSRSPARIIGDTENYRYPGPPPNDSLYITFDWNTICAHIKGQAYDVVFKVTNDPPPYPATPPPDPHIPPNLATFASWKITVIAPAPVLNTAVAQTPQRHVQLNWANYNCANIADASTVMQIWRKVGETTYMPGTCDTGMPQSLGFTRIASVPLTDVQYVDTNGGLGLERGVQYCYRLVAVFPNRGAESIVSNEVCIEPMDIEAPLITEVSVKRTSETDGEIKVTWLPPFNPQHDPAEYTYQLERATSTGFMTVSDKLDMPAGPNPSISFTDEGLNTLNQQYAYRVMLYWDGQTDAFDSSSVASSVWLTLTTSNKQINLSWRANVPWSNQVVGVPHDIYRAQVTSAETLSELTFYKTVDVTAVGLQYSDTTGLDSALVYCYAVVARGTYGDVNDPSVPDPLINDSQINCAQPKVLEPPCAPVIAAFPDVCSDFVVSYSCTASAFRTTIRWSMPKNCGDDIVRYEVYQTSLAGTPPEKYGEPIVTVTDTFAIIEGQRSLAYCYRIRAVDRSGSRSEYSAEVCSENCPYYELPNVFSPNGDNCNDVFSAYGVDIAIGEPDPDGPSNKCKVPTDLEYVSKCARFVQRVDFKVFNRWGREIYDYTGQDGNENTIYINWDGRDKSGKELATGIYFYSADVTFSSTAPGGRSVKTLKGWVHLIR